MADKVVILTNFMMEQYIEILSSFLDRRDIVGYAAARNTRRLGEASVDYAKIKTELLREYGTTIKDEDGNDTNQIAITSDSKDYEYVRNKLDISGNIEHEVTIFTITYEDVINKLTGNEILEIDWMIESS